MPATGSAAAFKARRPAWEPAVAKALCAPGGCGRVVEASLRAPVQPTETAERVMAAVRNLFPAAELHATERGVEGSSPDAGRLAALIREQRIPDTARGVMLRGQDGGRTRFHVSKQVAAVGKLNFASREGPLGDISVELRAADAAELTRFVDEVAPDTRGWTLEARGLTEKGLRSQDDWEGTLDGLEREADEGP
jgi:uncharacterized protein